MRPIWAVSMTVAALVAFVWLRRLTGGWLLLTLLVDGLAFALFAPVVMALFLVRRRRLGRGTSVAFTMQAVLLVLCGLVMPEFGPGPVVTPLGPVREADAQSLEGLGYLLALGWLLLVPVTAWLAWTREGKSAVVA
jgi:hypothetical protein